MATEDNHRSIFDRFENVAWGVREYTRDHLLDEFIAGILLTLLALTFTWNGLSLAVLIASAALLVRVLAIANDEDSWLGVLDFVALILALLSYFGQAPAVRPLIALRGSGYVVTAFIVLLAVLSLGKRAMERAPTFPPLALFYLSVAVMTWRFFMVPTVPQEIVSPASPPPRDTPRPEAVIETYTDSDPPVPEPPTPSPPPTVTPSPTAIQTLTATLLPTVTPRWEQTCPDMLLPERRPAGADHLVEKGETLQELAAEHGSSVDALVEANAPFYPTLWERPDCIREGWWLIIP